MSYVEHCKKHGQHHSEICGECHDDLQTENKKLKNVLTRVLTHAIVYRGVPEFDHVIDVVENSRVLGE